MSDEHEMQTQADATEEGSPDASSDATGSADLARVRDLVLAAHPDVVPEMIQGESFDELMASVEPARDAYQRIASQAAEQAAQPEAAPRVAAQPGRRGAAVVDMDGMSPLAKISEGLRRG